MGYLSRNTFEKEIPELYPRLHRSMTAFAGGSNIDVDDILQETFLKAYKKIDQFDGQSSLFTWLYSIARNLIMDEFRHQQRMPQRSHTPADEFEITDDSPNSAKSNREEIHELRNAISELPDILRDIVVMKTLEGLSYDEICQITGVNTETLKNRMFRAKKYLAVSMQKKKV